MTAVTSYYDWEKPAAFPIPGGEYFPSSEVAEALAGFLEPSDSPLFAIDDIFNAAADDNVFNAAADDNFFADSIFAAVPDNIVSSRSPPPDHCSLHCCDKRQRCCYSGDLQQPLCFEPEFSELQQLLCLEAEESLCLEAEFVEPQNFQQTQLAEGFEQQPPPQPQHFEQTPFSAEFAELQKLLCLEAEQPLCFSAEFTPAEPQEPIYYQPTPLAEHPEPPPPPPQHFEQTPISTEFSKPQQLLCFEAEQSLCFSPELTPAEPPEPNYFQPTPMAEHPQPPPPQHFDQTPFSTEFTFDRPPKTASGIGLSAQSVAARERRKKISDRTQELSRLIPGGGRMNTAEMLQAAHGYVRCLQAQIGILELDKGKSRGEEEEGLFQVLISSTAIQEKLSKQGMCLVPAVIAEEFMEREINKFSELIGEKA